MDVWTDRLSEYLDGTLAGSERAALDAHLAGCAACAATLEELRRVVARAQNLQDWPPAMDLWPGVAERIGVSPGLVSLPARRARRAAFSSPRLIAARLAPARARPRGAAAARAPSPPVLRSHTR